VLATEGIIEASSFNGDMFGKNRLYGVIRQNASASAKEILNASIDAVDRFQKDIQPEDDLTLAVIKIERD
jgi:sigma-B regulation protein RsbU (phosphoserine phosphatase)